MYRRGLTPRQISVLCDVPLVRVNRTLGWSKRRDMTLAAEHAEHAPEHPPRITDTWNKRYSELRIFRDSVGRMPYAHTAAPIEASLGRWLARQRRALRHGKLGDVCQRRLDELGEWYISARTHRDANRWSLSLENLASFRASSNRFPSFKNYMDETERRLGTWLHVQRQAASNGTLAPQRIADLDATVSGWNTWQTRR